MNTKLKYRYSVLAVVLFWQCVAAFSIRASAVESQDDFVIKPYLQLGNHPSISKEEKQELFWACTSNRDQWQLETKNHNESKWKPQRAPTSQILSYSVPDKLYIFDNPIENLESGAKFDYRLSKNGQKIFAGESIARKSADQPYRFVLFGDTGANTDSEKKIVYQTYKHKPDFLIILGDIVYNFGCLSEYLEKFFPIFSNDRAAEHVGAPLLQSTLTFGVIGNHDIAYGANRSGVDFNRLRDALAFYQLWSEPLNGPLKQGAEHSIPKLLGTENIIQKYIASTGSRYPQMSNYSFEYGNSHWLVLDANAYMDWNDQKLRDWVRDDLKAAQSQTWRFVCFHQPGFSIDKTHYGEQRMRLLSDIFQTCGVDVVFSGHAHNYQRSYPFVFHSHSKNGAQIVNHDGTIDGDFIIDKKFDGSKITKPSGVIYIVSGGGGAALYGALSDKGNHTATAGPDIIQRTFTDKFLSSTHSFTVCDVQNNKLKLSQISEDGEELDSFSIDKNNR